ncbi:TetR/AcrR family transcriptional regulator [Phytohabitans sp. ZYX-F-186]|uniref:TetR/AcrR family transcriptional regulator n=1 Tax=Phytohabitans maris TaxID=3071409 RepID=A0ABU0ZBP4_9ACTN|nr:TetR/AcrR family transcriptional regulator [Phytohabitans sp. ZYX-F-186]MDQ7904465.1 TetR/AcrR family transcriptional regulator [Phytohabitans sp. ZYX-F-186]
MGLREQKKEQTRRLITETAWRLFADRGFDRVSVAEVARAAQVAETTVFNYFRTKEDLFYSGLEGFGAELVDAVRQRAAGESALAAFRRFLLGAQGVLARIAEGDAEALARARSVMEMIARSPRLRAREQEALAHITDGLADLLAQETGAAGDDLTARVAANALVGVHRTLIEYVRRRVLADDGVRRLADDVRVRAESAFALLERGLGDYATR